MSALAGMFPGQGAQQVGMGRDVAERYAVARATFDEADAALGFKLSQVIFEGPEARLAGTDIQQPAIFTVSVAIFRAALDAGLFRTSDFGALGGLSLGEYTALHLAGALSFADGVRALAKRGQLMQQASTRQAGGMVALTGLDEVKVHELCERVASHGHVQPANFNCPGQIVISGDKAACDAAVALVGEFGGRGIPLPVAGAFHSPHMQPAADGLREILAACDFRKPSVRVIANLDAQYHSEPDAIRESLYRQLVNPVRWQECVQRMIADGCDHFWEVGPNRHLTGMMRKIDRRMKVTNVSTVGDLAPAAG